MRLYFQRSMDAESSRQVALVDSQHGESRREKILSALTQGCFSDSLSGRMKIYRLRDLRHQTRMATRTTAKTFLPERRHLVPGI